MAWDIVKVNLTERGNGYLSTEFEAAPKDGGFKVMGVKQVWDLWPAGVELMVFMTCPYACQQGVTRFKLDGTCM